ncbi:type VII secretion integral membrane protein EccD [Nocardia yamanashiensis]|uniref:type VII secretion integral membrane protein EccD n=1 Tax=Nocardia yamanashiensis TaxID=209247 RepID=UPI001E611AB5|nr:type VII secretion integral membrane protein EccD [Nocardia yamanashiensis]UGT39655.1 type VII secretion integral membrane protein EccD [Nocardia yamanashiensis]
MTAQSLGGLGATEPELCRVSVIGGNTQLDVGLPANTPIAAFIDDLVKLIESRDPEPLGSEEGGTPLQPQHWTLAKLGRDMIAPNQTLNDAEIYDGELLVLRAVAAKESPALFDDVIDAVSRLTAEEFRGWSPSSARWTGLAAGAVAVLMALVLGAVSRGNGDDFVAPAMLLGGAVAALVAAMIAKRKYADELTASVLTLCLLLLTFGGAALAVPGELGSPHLMLGATATLLVAVVGYRVIGAGGTIVATAVTLVVLAGGAAAVRVIWDAGTVKIAAGVLITSILLLSMVPRLAAMLARLPVPPVPTAGAAIDPADHEPRPTIEGIGAIGATVLPSAHGLGQRARTANQFQTGMVIGSAVGASFGAVVAADPLGSPRWQGIALAVVVAVILCLRGRSFADLTQATTLIAGGCVTFVSLLVLLALADPEMPLLSAGLLLAFAVGAIGFGVIGPHVEVTPVTRRFNEIFEYGLIVSIVPLVLWLMDVYSMARNI